MDDFAQRVRDELAGDYKSLIPLEDRARFFLSLKQPLVKVAAKSAGQHGAAKGPKADTVGGNKAVAAEASQEASGRVAKVGGVPVRKPKFVNPYSSNPKVPVRPPREIANFTPPNMAKVGSLDKEAAVPHIIAQLAGRTRGALGYFSAPTQRGLKGWWLRRAHAKQMRKAGKRDPEFAIGAQGAKEWDDVLPLSAVKDFIVNRPGAAAGLAAAAKNALARRSAARGQIVKGVPNAALIGGTAVGGGLLGGAMAKKSSLRDRLIEAAENR